MPKFKKFTPGEIVEVRRDLVIGQKYGGCVFTEEMANFRSCVIIDSMNPDGTYNSLGSFNWSDNVCSNLTWSAEMLKKPKKKMSATDKTYYFRQACWITIIALCSISFAISIGQLIMLLIMG